MDVERTTEFILQQQAKTETRMAAMQKQMAGIQTLVRTGMRILVKQGEALRQLAVADREVKVELRELARISHQNSLCK
jgi:hypothetical protein